MNIVTKVFIVLQLVFSIALAVIVFLTAGSAKTYKDALEGERLRGVAAQASLVVAENNASNWHRRYDEAVGQGTTAARELQTKLDSTANELVKVKAALDAALVDAKEKENTNSRSAASIAALSKQVEALSAELNQIRPDYTKAIQAREETNRRNGDLENRLALAEKAIRTLKEELVKAQEAKSTGTAPAAATVGTGTVAQMSDGTPTTVQINGKIDQMAQTQGRTYLTLSLGSRDGVQVGTRFTIYRKSQYVGDAIVRRVTTDQSVAEVTMVKPGLAVQKTDLVISGGGM